MMDRFVLAYIDIGTPDGSAVAKEQHVDSTPTLQVLGADAKEIWRLTSPGTADELTAALQELLNGKTYQQQEQLLKTGSLGPQETLTLAMSYLDRGALQRGHALLRKIMGDPSVDQDLRRQASFSRIEHATPKKRLELLPQHLRTYPNDMIALINYGYALRAAGLDKRRVVIRQVADGLNAEKDLRLKHAGYRLVVQFVAYEDPASAAWALPFALERLKLEPSDLDNLSEFASIAVLANQPGQIDTAKQLVSANAPANKIDDAIAEGIRLAAKSASATGSHGQE
jgi:hypothetical protein